MSDAEMIEKIRLVLEGRRKGEYDDLGSIRLIEFVLDTNKRNARNVAHQAAVGV